MSEWVRMDIAGHKEVNLALDLLGKRAGRALSAAARKALRPVVNEAKANAIFPEGTDTLHRSLKAKIKANARTGIVLGAVGADASVVGRDEYGNPRRPVRYLHLLEFGTGPRIRRKSGGESGSVKRHPIIRPAWGVAKLRTRRIFAKVLWDEINRQAKKSGLVRRARIAQIPRGRV